MSLKNFNNFNNKIIDDNTQFIEPIRIAATIVKSIDAENFINGLPKLEMQIVLLNANSISDLKKMDADKKYIKDIRFLNVGDIVVSDMRTSFVEQALLNLLRLNNYYGEK